MIGGMGSKYERIGDSIAAGRFDEASALVRAAIKEASGNQTAAAASLGVSGRTMRRWIARLAKEGRDVRTKPEPAEPEQVPEARPKKRTRAA